MPVGPARAASADVGTSLEAWYATMPTTPLQYRPPDRLHVGMLVGREESRSYVALDLAGVDAERVTGGLLRLPVDPASSRSPELARIDVCVAGTPGPAVKGSTDAPPPADCSTASPATFDGAARQMVADLGPFASSLRTASLALVPRSPDAGDTWHVAIWGAGSSAPEARPIRATLMLREATPTTPTSPSSSPSAPSVAAGPAPSSTFGGADHAFAATSGLDFRDPAEPVIESAPAPVPQLGAPAAEAASTVGAPVRRRSAPAGAFGTSPPDSVAFAVPLVLLALAGYLGSALTRPAGPTTDGPRRGRRPGAGARWPSTDG